MTAKDEVTASIEAALLEGASVRRVLDLQVAGLDDGLLVAAKVDLPAELTMKEVSVILHQARRRVREAAPEAVAVFVEPEVWIDPNAAQPTTSAVVTLSYD